MRHYYFGCLLLLLGLAACTSPEQRAAMAAQQEHMDTADCERLGFKRASEAFGDCMLKQREIRAQERAWRSYYEPMPRFGVDFRERRGH